MKKLKEKKWLIIPAAAIYFLFIRGKGKKVKPSAKIAIDGQEFPEGFLWATAEDPYQHEGCNENSDWALWEKQKSSPYRDGATCSRSVDFFNRFEDDFNLAKKDHQNAHRIGIEWSRVEPEEGIYDEEAFAHYEKMLASMKEKGFVVFLNLWHFTLPIWAYRQGGWENPVVLDRWEAYVEECARRFGKYVDYWSTMIDAQVYAGGAYLTGALPPHVKDKKLAMQIFKTLVYAHARAYRAIKEYATIKEKGQKTKIPQVGMIHLFQYFESAGSVLDNKACSLLNKLFNWTFLDALSSGELNIYIPGEPLLKVKDNYFSGTLDWIGVNYFTREITSFNPLKTAAIGRSAPVSGEKTDMGWDIYPEGLYHICKEVYRRYCLPIMITENGLADNVDNRRPRFIMDHLSWVHRLIGEGYPIKGYTYWSLTDNLEWLEGFRSKFGLYRVDLDTLERKETESARLYRFIAKNNRLPRQGDRWE